MGKIKSVTGETSFISHYSFLEMSCLYITLLQLDFVTSKEKCLLTYFSNDFLNELTKKNSFISLFVDVKYRLCCPVKFHLWIDFSDETSYGQNFRFNISYSFLSSFYRQLSLFCSRQLSLFWECFIFLLVSSLKCF